MAQNALFDQTLESRFNAENLSTTQAKMLSKYFSQTMLKPLTDVQRIWMLNQANVFIYEAANMYLNGDATAKKMGERELLALGVVKGNKELENFAQFMVDNGGRLPSPEQMVAKDSLVQSEMGNVYAKATNTLISEIIQNPQKTDKPELASHSVARAAYGILSFLYAFFSNVTIGVAKEAKEKAKINGNIEYAKAAGYYGATFAGLFAAHLLVTIGREFLRNGDRWDEWDEEDELLERLVNLAASRTGILGPFDHVYQMLNSVRYQVDLANGILGAQAGYFARHLTKVAYPIFRNSENTDTAERNLISSLYNLLALPASAMAYAYMGPANIATNAVLYPAYQTMNNYRNGRELGEFFYPEGDDKKPVNIY